MGMFSYIQNRIRYKRRKRKLKLRFPYHCKIHGVKIAEYQSALVQSRENDGLQIVHVPIEGYPHNTFVYSIPLNRVLGYLAEETALVFIDLFGTGFCVDGKLVNRVGGPPLKYYGANIEVYETRKLMKDCKDFSHLYGT